MNFQPQRWFLVRNISASEAARFFGTIDMVEIEHGWVLGNSDAGDLSGWTDLIAKIDYIHSLGTSVFTWEFAPGYNQCESNMSGQQETYSLAMWFVMWADGDHYGTFSHDGRECGDTFSPLYEKNLGLALGPRTSCGSGCYQRQFQAGTVTANVITKTGTIP
jgi:hypothetical protein